MSGAAYNSIALSLLSALASFNLGDIDDLKKRHAESVGQIESLHLNLEIEYDPPMGTGQENIEYWKNGDEFKIRIKNPQGAGGESEIYANKGIQKGYDIRPPKAGAQPIRGGSIYPRGGPIGGDPFLLCLLSVPGNTAFRVPFSVALEEPHELLSFKSQKLAGFLYETAVIQQKDNKFEARFSERHNFLIDRLTIWEPDQLEHASSITEVNEFKELGPGVFFPTVVTSKQYVPKSGKLLYTRLIKVKQADLNKPILKEDLAFHFPPNILITDAIKNKLFFTDDSGEPSIDARNSEGKLYKLIKGPVSPKSALSGDTRPTEEEPTSYFRWVFYASIVLILIGALLLTFRKTKKE